MRRHAESVIALALLLVAGTYIRGIFQIEGREITGSGVGPTTFPWLLAIALILLAVSLLAGQMFRYAGGGDEPADAVTSAGGRMAAAVLLIFIYAAALKPLGFLWTTPFFLVLLSQLYDRRRLPLAAVTAVAMTFAVHTLARYVFGVVLP
jgi:hypothetical protein